MDTGDAPEWVVPFQLQFDKPVPSQIKIAEWNPEKDLLAMVTEDSKILLHRFNWQRLWTISPGRSITSLCWRPDGKALAVGLEDGTLSLHDVENGKLLRSIKSHHVAIVCLNWEEDGQDDCCSISAYEDRTTRFFPPPPRAPRMPGLVSGDGGFMDDTEESLRELSNSSYQRFNILCSGDKDGGICFSIFGIFPIAKINIHQFPASIPHMGDRAIYWLLNAFIYKVSLSKDLCHMTVMCSGELVEDRDNQRHGKMSSHGLLGLHCLILNTSIFWQRKNELHQVALQASNIEDLQEVIKSSLSVMHKQWSDAMHTFHQKFDSLSTLIRDHGINSTSQEEFLSLLGGARTSPALHQFLVNSLGEAGMKRISKAVCSAGKELQLVVLDHLQPAAEVIGFRVGELRGLSKWRSRCQGIGLDGVLIDNATEKAGIFLVQVERFSRVLSSVVQQFSNFFSWLHKCIKILMSEPCDQLPPFNSELIVIFFKFLYDQDPVKQLLEITEREYSIENDVETMQRVRESVQFGGFSDSEYLRRTLAKEFQLMESCFKEAFQMPFSTISKKIYCEDLVPLFSFPSFIASAPFGVPTSISHFKVASEDTSTLDYISFKIPDESFFDSVNCIGIARGLMHNANDKRAGGCTSMEAVLLCHPKDYTCVDLSLYKDSQIVLLLNNTTDTSEGTGNGHMVIVQMSDLPFVSVSRQSNLNQWMLHELNDSAVYLQLENEKARSIPHSVVSPLAVSASRGVACVFAARKRALVYILEEDEDETVSDEECQL